MPVYDLRCQDCGKETDNVYHRSGDVPACVCGGPQEHVWKASAPVHIFPEGFFENASGPDGKSPYFSSRQKYKSYLKEMGMYADLVEGR